MIRQTFDCIDAHTCGNPVRLVRSGMPALEGNNMREKRQHFIREFDWIRRGLMFEPRGHDMMSGSMLYPPHDPANDTAVLYIETSGCLPMCGHGTIGTVTIAIEEQLVQPKLPGQLRLETPAGLVLAAYEQDDRGKVRWVELTNVPSFVAAMDLEVQHPSLGALRVHVAYGGNFYAIVDTQQNYPGLQAYDAAALVRLSQELRQQLRLDFPERFVHPEDDTIHGISHVMWTGRTISAEAHGRAAVFYGDKAIDRSPCGTGTSARMALLHAQGKLKIREEFVHESIIGSTFIGSVAKTTQVGDEPAIVPRIKGWARVYGHNRITIDEEDPYAFGFQVI